jgi:peptidoglycan/LPS O-acetylase OafA/YrhL
MAVAVYLFGRIDVGMRTEDFWWGVPRVCLSFFIGVSLRRYFYEQLSFDLRGTAAILVLVLLVLAFSLTRFVDPEHLPAVELLVVVFAFPSLLLMVVTATPGRNMAAICKLTGDASYPVYLLQVPFMGLVAAFFQLVLDARAGAAVPWGGLTHVVGTIILALLIDRYYEWPLRRLLKNHWQRLRGAPRRAQ